MPTNNKAVTVYLPDRLLNWLEQYCVDSDCLNRDGVPKLGTAIVQLLENASSPTSDRSPQMRLESAITTIEPIELDYLDIDAHDTWQEACIGIHEVLGGQIAAVDSLNQIVARAIADIRSIDLVVIGKPDNDWSIDWQEKREKLDPGIDPHDDQAWHEHYKVPTVIKRLEQLENAVGVLLRDRQQKDDRQLDRPGKRTKASTLIN